MNAAKRLLASFFSRASMLSNGMASVSGRRGPKPSPACALAQLLAQFAGPLRDVRLDHRRSATVQLFADRCDHRRMIVPDVVHAVSRQKIENAPPTAD
jgi:hypothetical protein